MADIYGDVIRDTAQQLINGHAAAVEMRSVIHLSLCDAIPAHGTIADMTFALTRNGVSRYLTI